MSFITSYLITLLFKHQNYWGMEEHASTIHAAINSLIAIIAIRTIAYLTIKKIVNEGLIVIVYDNK